MSASNNPSRGSKLTVTNDPNPNPTTKAYGDNRGTGMTVQKAAKLPETPPNSYVHDFAEHRNELDAKYEKIKTDRENKPSRGSKLTVTNDPNPNPTTKAYGDNRGSGMTVQKAAKLPETPPNSYVHDFAEHRNELDARYEKIKTDRENEARTKQTKQTGPTGAVGPSGEASGTTGQKTGKPRLSDISEGG